MCGSLFIYFFLSVVLEVGPIFRRALWSSLAILGLSTALFSEKRLVIGPMK